jgi:hypothetical protein
MSPARNGRQHRAMLEKDAIELPAGERVGFRQGSRENAATEAVSNQFSQPARIVAAMPNVPRQTTRGHCAGDSLFDMTAEANHERLAIERL